MPDPTDSSAVHAFVTSYLRDHTATKQIDGIALSDDLNMVDSGLLGSIDFIEMVATVEDEFGIEIDLADHDPVRFTTVGGFVEAAAQAEPSPS